MTAPKPRLRDVEARTDVGPDLLHDPDSRTVVQSVDRYTEMVDDLSALTAAIRAVLATLQEVADRHPRDQWLHPQTVRAAIATHVDLGED